MFRAQHCACRALSDVPSFWRWRTVVPEDCYYQDKQLLLTLIETHGSVEAFLKSASDLFQSLAQTLFKNASSRSPPSAKAAGDSGEATEVSDSQFLKLVLHPALFNAIHRLHRPGDPPALSVVVKEASIVDFLAVFDFGTQACQVVISNRARRPAHECFCPSSAGRDPDARSTQRYGRVSRQMHILNLDEGDVLPAKLAGMFNWRLKAKFSFFRVRLLLRCTESETVLPVPKVRRARAVPKVRRARAMLWWASLGVCGSHAAALIFHCCASSGARRRRPCSASC
jgi:hypothetical protein